MFVYPNRLDLLPQSMFAMAEKLFFLSFENVWTFRSDHAKCSGQWEEGETCIWGWPEGKGSYLSQTEKPKVFKVSRTWKPTCDMEIRLHRELGSISRRILGSHWTVGSVLVQSPDLKHQDKTVSACHSGSSTMFQTNFPNHYTLLSSTKLSFQIILSINFSLLLLTVTLLSLNTHLPSGICSTLFHLIV